MFSVENETPGIFFSTFYGKKKLAEGLTVVVVVVLKQKNAIISLKF